MNWIALGIAIVAIVFLLVKWVVARWDNEELKKDNASLRRTIDTIGGKSPEEDDEEEDPELAVGSEVEIDLEGWRVRGKIESVASGSLDKKNIIPGFSFRAHNDPNTMWLSHNYNMTLVEEVEDEDDEEDSAAHADREFLWSLLDDISTMDDACKFDDAAYRREVRKIAEKRTQRANSFDGQTLVWNSDRPTPTEPIAAEPATPSEVNG